jgi:MoaA/NifB/PqqE/SkfB family radical SAM enzyme
LTQRGIYSELKPAWHYCREGKLPAVPKQVQLILSDLCNQDCNFCAYRMSGNLSNELFMAGAEASKYGHNNPKRWIPTARALGLLHEMKDAGVLAIQFTGGGEPTVHPDHEQIFQYALHRGLRASLVSNGVRWSNLLIKELLPNFDWVRVSIDAAHEHTYTQIRNTTGAAWKAVWRNVGQLAAAIRAAKSETRFGLGFVVTPESWSQLYDFAEIAKGSGVDNVRFTAMFSPRDEKPFENIYTRVKEELDKAKTLADDGFSVHDNFGSRFADLKQHAPDYKTCTYGRILGGNVAAVRWDSFWNDPRRLHDLASLDARDCERCQFHEKNRAVNYLMQNSPKHKEWP